MNEPVQKAVMEARNYYAYLIEKEEISGKIALVLNGLSHENGYSISCKAREHAKDEIMNLFTGMVSEKARWRKYPEEKPTDYGTYWVYRKGCKKAHKETWNNTGWAYNNNDITHWRHLPENPKD